MRVHHIDAGTMRIPGAPIVSHVLVCESDDGLVLVDSGFGLADVREPTRLGPVRFMMRPVLDEARTALRQVETLGFAATDVRHVVDGRVPTACRPCQAVTCLPGQMAGYGFLTRPDALVSGRCIRPRQRADRRPR